MSVLTHSLTSTVTSMSLPSVTVTPTPADCSARTYHDRSRTQTRPLRRYQYVPTRKVLEDALVQYNTIQYYFIRKLSGRNLKTVVIVTGDQ